MQLVVVAKQRGEEEPDPNTTLCWPPSWTEHIRDCSNIYSPDHTSEKSGVIRSYPNASQVAEIYFQSYDSSQLHFDFLHLRNISQKTLLLQKSYLGYSFSGAFDFYLVFNSFAGSCCHSNFTPGISVRKTIWRTLVGYDFTDDEIQCLSILKRLIAWKLFFAKIGTFWKDY